MLIKLSPFVPLPGDGVEMRVSVRGDALTVNGVEFDFSPLTEGGQLPGAAIGSSWFEGVITRQAGRIELTLRLPLAPDASDAARFPAPIEVLEGDVELPR
ncbi:hypothetical protein [Pseudomonas aeruginosa]|uniref:hypothetical protein n=1 Tax=Pseudomonas aeruginosa TaxID=287 RepID=UPI0022EAC3FA|nr:hypothetical protein [Pseudomonas aeruginosa]MDA3352877.1 hypothetical protein [Pseudomonas aeruginosa]